MNRTTATYEQLDKLLRSLGFTCRLIEEPPPQRVYEHQASGAFIMLPKFAEKDHVLSYHYGAVQTTLSMHGIVDPTHFAAELKSAG